MSDAATLMDRMYVHQRHFYDATRKFYLLGRDELIADLAPPPNARILEIACGTGRNLVKIAKLYPDAQCYGIDISEEMLITARQKVADAGLGARIQLAPADATALDPEALFGVRDFDRIVISYALSMIPCWREVLEHAADLLAPAGSLRVVDFGDQARLPSAFKRMLHAWLARFHVTPRPTLPHEIAALAGARGLSVRTHAPFRGYAVAAELGATSAS